MPLLLLLPLPLLLLLLLLLESLSPHSTERFSSSSDIVTLILPPNAGNGMICETKAKAVSRKSVTICSCACARARIVRM
jgi:hypothetical protein